MESETVENTTTYMEEQQADEAKEAKEAEVKETGKDNGQEAETLEDKGQEEIDKKEDANEPEKEAEKKDDTPKWMKRELFKEREARRRLQAQLDDMSGKVQEVAQKEDPKPNPDTFEDISKYHEELGRWAARDEARKESARRQEKHQKEQQTQTYDTARADFERQADSVREQHDDFDEKMQDLAWTTREKYGSAIAQGLMTCIVEAGTPEAAYELADKPAELEKIIKLGSTHKVAARLGALEKRLTGVTPVKIKSSAPPPRKGVESSGKTEGKMPDASDTKKWMEARAAQLKKMGGYGR